MRPPRYPLARPDRYRPSLITPFPAPLTTSYHFPSPYAITGGLDSRKNAFSRIRRKWVTDGRTDGRI